MTKKLTQQLLTTILIVVLLGILFLYVYIGMKMASTEALPGGPVDTIIMLPIETNDASKRQAIIENLLKPTPSSTNETEVTQAVSELGVEYASSPMSQEDRQKIIDNLLKP